MYYVSYIEEYPIYEAAEGGYFYPGETVIDSRACKSWRKARKVFNEWRKWFEKEYGAPDGNSVHLIEMGGCDLYGNGSEISLTSKYVGEGCAVRLTRYKPHDKGYTPYC